MNSSSASTAEQCVALARGHWREPRDLRRAAIPESYAAASIGARAAASSWCDNFQAGEARSCSSGSAEVATPDLVWCTQRCTQEAGHGEKASIGAGSIPFLDPAPAGRNDPYAILNDCGPLAQLVRAEDLMGDFLTRGVSRGRERSTWVAQGKFALP